MPATLTARPERLFGVCGYPLGQSLSPALHTWAMGLKKIPAAYTSWETPPDALPAFMRAFRATPYDGASVTIPHKAAVIAFLDGVTETASAIGAVNTLYWRDGKLMGHNTDLAGFLAPLAACPIPETALVLGAGGAARAVIAGLADLKLPRVVIAARGREKAERLADGFGGRFVSLRVTPWEERERIPANTGGLWVINTTPIGMRGKAEGESPLSPAFFASAGSPGARLAYDLVYNPLETAFLSLARAQGWTCRDGLDMFVAQAAAQFGLWTGEDMPLDQARAFLLARLQAHVS